MAKVKPPCMKCGLRPKLKGRHRCYWCFLDAEPIEAQVNAADARLRWTMKQPGYVPFTRISPKHWPEGHRPCAGCQSWIPVDYVRGSRCKACNSRDSHGSHVARTYGLGQDVYAALLAWQGGRCYMCGRTPRSRRLAVDHDHSCCAGPTSCGRCVRGLLCADDERGCNHALLGLLENSHDPIAMARRIVDYLQEPPLQRMVDGQPPPEIPARKVVQRILPVDEQDPPF